MALLNMKKKQGPNYDVLQKLFSDIWRSRHILIGHLKDFLVLEMVRIAF